MSAFLLINRGPNERRVALVENGVTTELYFEGIGKENVVGNIYKGKVVRILPGMQSAFVDIGLPRAGFLFVGDVVPRPPSGTERPKGRPDYPPIKTLLTQGQELMVQVTKEPIGTKGARLSTHIGLPGRFLVYSPNDNQVGVSRRIEDPAERERLRALAEELKPESAGLIVRTVGEGLEPEAFAEDLKFLGALWKDIQSKVAHQDLDVTLRSLRDLVTEDVERVLVDHGEEALRIRDFIRGFLPHFDGVIEMWAGPDPMFERFGLEWEISRATRRKVWLKSGGYIIIDRTEALTAVDVNTGKFVGKSDFEETIVDVNMEAVREIAYQLRLRDIGGIIILDFVDMRKKSNQKRVRDALIEALASDRAKTHVLPMSAIGLIEMTRKRVRHSLVQGLTTGCFYCDGKGYLKSVHVMESSILSNLTSQLASGRTGTVTVSAHPTITEHLVQEHQRELDSLGAQYGAKIEVVPREDMHFEDYEIQ